MTLAALLLFAAVESTCVPINSDMFWVTLPDGKADFFLRDAKDPNILIGTAPWFGVVRPEVRMVNIATQKSYRGRSCEYGFVDGHLRFASEGGKDREVAVPPPPKPTDSARGFWPTLATWDEQLKKNDMWKGGGRLRFISRNPNRTALFLCQLCLLAMGVMLFSRRRIWQVHGAIWTLIFLILQFQALSRGGMLAFLAGAGVTVYFRFRRRLDVRTLCGLAAVGALLLAACYGVYRNRLADEVSGDSRQSRTAIWREVPRMIAAAPLGWGLWKSGPAYNAWFERPERRHMIGDLFNDHLSRFVEGGFVWGGLYVFAWSFVLCAGWRWARRGGSPAYLAVWLAYFVAACFNPMVWWGKSFIVPGAVSAVWIARALRGGRNAGILRCSGVALIATAVVLAGLGAAAARAPAQDVPLRVSALGRRIIAGTGEPDVWVADDGFVLNGNFNGYPGREFRSFWRKRPNAEAVGLVERVDDLPASMDRLVLTGTCGEDYLKMTNPPKAKHVIFLSPPFGSTKIPDSLRKECDVHLLTGEFVARLTGDIAKDEPWIHVVPGVQVYVPGWLESVVRGGNGKAEAQ